MQILSLQSRVAYGHVGNSTAVPVLQRLGHEVVAVDTTLLSNHLGYAAMAGASCLRSKSKACSRVWANSISSRAWRRY